MLTTKVFFTDTDIYFRVSYDNSKFIANTDHLQASFKKTLKYSIKKDKFRFTSQKLKQENKTERIGVEDDEYGIILGKVNYLRKKCVVLTRNDTPAFFTEWIRSF